MSRRLFSRLLSYWTRNQPNRGLAASPNWPSISIQLRSNSTGPIPCLYPAEKLDELHDLILVQEKSEPRPTRPSQRSSGLGPRQGALPHIVDRAIADLTNPRRRSSRPRW